jgi:hypothetical protein
LEENPVVEADSYSSGQENSSCNPKLRNYSQEPHTAPYAEPHLSDPFHTLPTHLRKKNFNNIRSNPPSFYNWFLKLSDKNSELISHLSHACNMIRPFYFA